MKVHTIKRQQILGGFKSKGFKNFTAVCNVCLSLDTSISSLKLSMWWRVGLPEHQSVLFHNKLETILEMLRYE